MTFRSPDPESGAATRLRHSSVNEKIVRTIGVEPTRPFDR